VQDSDLEEEDSITGINVTPLVDITLVLLIIFMVTARLISEPSFGVQLPRSSSASKTPISEDNVFLTIDEEDQVFLDGRPVRIADLTPALRDLLQKRPGIKVVLRADRRIRHGDVISVLDHVREAGITEFGIAVEGAGKP
jgi:biopolymer transport protein ExbD